VRVSAHIYRASTTSFASTLCQGEIISDLERIRLAPECLEREHLSPIDLIRVPHPLAIIMSQDCDLEQDFRVRQAENFPLLSTDRPPSDKLIPNVLFCNVVTAAQLYQPPAINSRIWERIKINKDERYHFLQSIEGGCDGQQIGLPELTIDFKRFFTMPTEEVYQRLRMAGTKRRACLNSPYLEHLSSRFSFYLGRVGLPEDHFSEPADILQGPKTRSP